MEPFTPIEEVKGVGEKTKKMFAKLGVYTVGDILLSFPRTYFTYPNVSDISSLQNKLNTNVAICAVIKTAPTMKKTRRGAVINATAFSDGIKINLTWFNAPYIRNSLQGNVPIVFYGKLTEEAAFYKMIQPEVFSVEKYDSLLNEIHPVYSLTKGLSNTVFKKTVKEALQHVRFAEHFDDDFMKKHDLCDINDAFFNIHFPDNNDKLIAARRRLVFDETFAFIMYMRLTENGYRKLENNFTFDNRSVVDNAVLSLPFELTEGQRDTVYNIMADMNGEYVNQRLIQGDVGCGKTVVAFLSMLYAVSNGYKAAIMAPTEVLARQHEKTLKGFIDKCGLDYEVITLTGSDTAARKRDIYARLESDDALFVVGTHALIQDKVKYNNLALVICDEQHRFGVKQRDVFSKKGQNPFTVVMSATPIPRTLSMILYSDMDVSVIKDVPAKKLPIKNCAVKGNKHNAAYKFIKNEVDSNHQAYIICPLVSASEVSEAESVVEYTQNLSQILPSEYRIGMLHGKMKAEQKDEIMQDFISHKIDVLVSTTVVEVGVDNPNATVIMIENADRFGLAQLHQLRGRVGRGEYQSYCIFMDSTESDDICKRLEIINSSNDGFYLAQKDLELRGPGDFYGVRQSGEINFRLADIFCDSKVFEESSAAVSELLKADPDLSSDRNEKIRHFINTSKINLYTNL